MHKLVAHVRKQRLARLVARYKQAVIRKEKGKGYCVKSPKNPDWNGGCYPSKGEAEKRLEQVEYFKRQAGTAATHVVEIYTTESGAKSVQDILERIDKLGAPGHSFSIKGDEGENLGSWDGDGADHIKEIKVREL